MFERLPEPGMHRGVVQGPVGDLEVAWMVPNDVSSRAIAILAHPDPRQDGTMDNKVVTTMTRVFATLRIASVRFNCRGVGLSTGTFDAGIGESVDMLYLAERCQVLMPEAHFFFVGFSFGSYVAYRAASHFPNPTLITIAPPVDRYDYQAFKPSPRPWIVVQGEEDDVVDPSGVFDFVNHAIPPIQLLRFKAAGHFFHGQLVTLKTTLIEVLKPMVLA